ncbi:DUF2252 family protein [Bacillus toyonensis]|uniref:DUF2252 family protein n=1 Tax=Bacillus toyonensis TaxID=155322 RepID=UPI0015D50BA9|nr:DUF2252 family protein [Bacillus toyonensis]
MKRVLYLCIVISVCCTVGCSFDTKKPQHTEQSKQQTNNKPSKGLRESYLQQQLQEENAFIQDSVTRANKYQKMIASPFSFYRGTTSLYYSDLRTGIIPIPAKWNKYTPIQIWLEGDAHAQNVAILNDREESLRFDVTDFKNAYVGPFYWDVLRFMSSIFLFTDELPHVKVSTTQQKQLALTFLKTYQKTLQQINENPKQKYSELRDQQLKNGWIAKQIEDIKSLHTYEAFLGQNTSLQNGKRVFLPNEPSFAPLSIEEQAEFTKGWKDYIKSIESFVDAKSKGYFTLKDVVHKKNSGIGSSGRDIFYALLEGDTVGLDDDVILEIKEQKLPAMFAEGQLSKEQYNRWFSSHAERTRIATRATGVEVDPHLGTLDTKGLSYSVKKLSPLYHEFEPADFHHLSDVEEFVNYAAQAFASMHARADKDYSSEYVPYHFAENTLEFMKNTPQFSEKLLQWSEDYYHQVVGDYILFKELVQNKKI